MLYQRIMFALVLFFVLPAGAPAGDLGYRLYKTETSGTYIFGPQYCVATARARDVSIKYVCPSSGTYYFVLTAFNPYGESGPSNEVSTTCDGGQTITFGWDGLKGEAGWAVTFRKTVVLH